MQQILASALILKEADQPFVMTLRLGIGIAHNTADIVLELVLVDRAGQRQQACQQPYIFYSTQAIGSIHFTKFAQVGRKHLDS